MHESISRSLRNLGLRVIVPLLAVTPVLARLNLPQAHQLVNLDRSAQVTVRDYLSNATVANPFPAGVQKALVNSLPQNLHSACGEVIDNWGDIARSSEEWSVRPLEQQSEKVWLAFRCGSRVPDYRDFYDERLALLRPGAGTLEFFPLGPDFGNDSTLYRLEFAERVRLPGTEGAAFRVLVPGENPCCDGGDRITEEHLVVFADSPGGTAQVISFATLRDQYSHDDVDGDAELIYKAAVKFQRNRHGEVVGAVATFTDEDFDVLYEGGKSENRLVKKQAGTLRYRWNPAAFKFEEVKESAPSR